MGVGSGAFWKWPEINYHVLSCGGIRKKVRAWSKLVKSKKPLNCGIWGLVLGFIGVSWWC